MTDTDLIAAMQRDVPAIPRSPEAAPPEILNGDADLAIKQTDAAGVHQEPPCDTCPFPSSRPSSLASV